MKAAESIGLDEERLAKIEARMEQAKDKATEAFEAKWLKDFWRNEKKKHKQRAKKKRARRRSTSAG